MALVAKKYHAFVSHSSLDKAERLARDLENRGYTVWFDSWEILVGSNIVDEVYRGITQSQFMVVLLSKASVQSRWVIEEFTSARTSEIEDRQVVILPAVIEDCDIPASLKGKRYADLRTNWESGLDEISRAIDGHQRAQTGITNIRSMGSAVAASSFEHLDQWRESLVPEMISAGFVEGQPFKDILIGPIGGGANVDRTQLKSIVDTSRARLANWGGLSFPLESAASTQQVHLPSGLRFVDSKLRLYGPEAFHFWQIESELKFLHRNPIAEDLIGNDNSGNSLTGTLIRSWTLADIMCPMLFARNLVANLDGLQRIGVKFVWGGLGNRILKELSQNRMRFFRQYQCQVSEWTFETEITVETDLAAEGKRAAKDLFWLFGWVPDPGLHDIEFKKLASGEFPG